LKGSDLNLVEVLYRGTVVIARVGTIVTIANTMATITMVTRVTVIMIMNFQVLRRVHTRCISFGGNVYFIRRETDSIFKFWYGAQNCVTLYNRTMNKNSFVTFIYIYIHMRTHRVQLKGADKLRALWFRIPKKTIVHINMGPETINV
jgi:hypothetical protein